MTGVSTRRAGDDRRGDRRPGRRPVDLGAGPARRRGRRALPGRARLGHDRRDRRRRSRRCPSCATSTATCTSATTAAGSSSARSSRTASRSPRRASRPTASPSSGRTGTTSRRSWPRPGSACRPSSRSASGTTCGRPSRFTPDSNFQLGFVPEVPGPVRGGRPQLAGDHLRAGRRPGGRRVDRRGPPDDGPRRCRRRADGRAGRPSGGGSTSGPSSRSAGCTRCTGRASSRRPRAACVGCRSTTQHRAAGARVRAGRRLGAAAVVRAGRRRPDRALRLPRPVVVPGRARGGPGDPRGGRPVRPDDLRQVPRRRARARWTGCSGWPRPTSTPTSGASSTRSWPTSAAASSWTRRSPGSTRRPVPRPGPDADPAPDRRACCGTGCRPTRS